MSATNLSFQGTFADSYDRYLVPLIFDDYARDLAGRATIRDGAAVLEVAAGTGVLTRHLRSSLPAGASVMATDLSPDMLSVAEAKLAGSRAVSFRVVDGTDLPFADDSFDAVFCQFGVMFFSDRLQGYAEAARVLRPGGTFAFNVWDDLAVNRLAGIVHETVQALIPVDPPDFLSVPFGYQDLTAIKADLARAGFATMEMSVNPGVSRAGSARNVVEGLVAGTPLGAALDELGMRTQVMKDVEIAIVGEFGPGAVAAPMQAIAIVAQLS